MIHLKYFESDEYNSYYKEINFDEYDDKACSYDNKNKLVDITQVELSMIKETIRKSKDIFKYPNPNHLADKSKSYLVVMDSKSSYVFIITKLKDEWFYIKDFTNIKYYCCDQFDGLIKFLDDKT
jgi:hypothetical protein